MGERVVDQDAHDLRHAAGVADCRHGLFADLCFEPPGIVTKGGEEFAGDGPCKVVDLGCLKSQLNRAGIQA